MKKKNGVFVGNGYCSSDLFKLNVPNIVTSTNVSSCAYINSYVYIIDSNDLWHGRLGHVNLYIKKTRELWLLSKSFQMENAMCVGNLNPQRSHVNQFYKEKLNLSGKF